MDQAAQQAYEHLSVERQDRARLKLLMSSKGECK